MDKIIVQTKEELEEAVERGENNIVVVGDLAKQLEKSLKIRRGYKWVLSLLEFFWPSRSSAGGMSQLQANSLAAFTGIEVACFLSISFLGLALILIIIKEYDEAIVRGKDGDKEVEIELKKRHPKDQPVVANC